MYFKIKLKCVNFWKKKFFEVFVDMVEIKVFWEKNNCIRYSLNFKILNYNGLLIVNKY